jgi:Uma2 family endonuclease
MVCLGSTTFKRQDKRKGTEPDDCYYFREAMKIRARKHWDPKRDPPPELVVEVDVTRRSVAREPVYAALGVPEIWRWERGQLICLVWDGRTYVPADVSRALPFLKPGELARFVRLLWTEEENVILRRFLKWVRARKWAQ